jgi:hypothetical protein
MKENKIKVSSKDKIECSIHIKDTDRTYDTTIIISNSLSGNKIRKNYAYHFNYYYEAIEEAISILNEDMNRAVLVSDFEAESCLLDLIIELSIKLDKIRNECSEENIDDF